MDFIDAHHHTWDHRVFPYPGVNDPHPIGDISHFKENYLITDLLDDAKNQNLIKSVHVECGGGGKDNPVEDSYTNKLLTDKSFSKEKVLEEINELIEAVDENTNIVHEAADVFYHLIMYLEANNIKIENIMKELNQRKK